MKADQQSCANRAWPDFGKSGTDNIKVYSHKESHYYGLSCGKTFSESRASVFYHLRTQLDIFQKIIPGYFCPNRRLGIFQGLPS